MHFCTLQWLVSDKVKGIPLSRNFIENVRGILNNTVQLHHSHVAGEILGYSHSYYDQKSREHHFEITVAAHNFPVRFLFSAERFKDWRLKKKRYKNRWENPTDVNFASIGN